MVVTALQDSSVSPVALLEQIEQTLPGSAPARPAGLHLSQIISHLMQTLKPKQYGGPLNEMKISCGTAYERVLEEALRQILVGSFRPPPVQKDGIWCSPDGIDPVEWSVDEFKLTWYSARRECPTDPVYWPWLVQIKGYCYVLETQLATLRVFWVNGDYAPPSPRYAEYRLQFTPLELQENWSMCKNAAVAEGWL